MILGSLGIFTDFMLGTKEIWEMRMLDFNAKLFLT